MSTNPNISVTTTDAQRAEENLYRDLSPEQFGADRGVSSEDRAREVVKPASQLSNQEILRETRELHAHFQQLSERYEQSAPAQRAEIRQEMEPLVNREHELREEFKGRVSPEMNQDRVPEMGYSR